VVIGLLRITLVAISLTSAIATIAFGVLFYNFYLRWIGLFEDGRYFDPASGVVYHDTGSVHGILMLLSLTVSVAAALCSRKLR
jgi:hypothetical protein